MKIGLVQLTSSDDIAQNIAEASRHIRVAAEKGATFVSTPETTHLMEMRREQVLQKAFYEADDPGLMSFCVLARKLQVWLHLGSLVIKIADGKLANRSFLISPTGDIVARYDKAHLFDVELGGGESYRESALYQAGDQAVLAHAADTPIGMTVCYDLRFPYLYRDLAKAGARILLVPAAFTQQTGEAHWHTLLRARAIENGCFVVAAAQTGLHATGRRTFGHSLVVDPWGTILADAGTEPGVTIVDLDLSKVDIVREKIPSLHHDARLSLSLAE